MLSQPSQINPSHPPGCLCVYVSVCACVCVCGNAHLQRGQHYLLHRGEVGLPQKLRLLSEGQDLVLVDGAHRGRDLQAAKKQQSVKRSPLAGEPKAPTGPTRAARGPPQRWSRCCGGRPRRSTSSFKSGGKDFALT